MQNTVVHSSISGRNVRSLEITDVSKYGDLRRVGIGFDQRDVEKMARAHYESYGMDSIQSGITTPSIGTPVQFLQSFLPGFVKIVTAAEKIDDLIGIQTAGQWHQEQVVQGVMELTGTAVPYGDYTNIPLSSWNVNWEIRDIVRFEEGMQVAKLEELRAAEMQVNSGDSKREAAGEALNIQRNLVGFYGYNNGNNKTYGFLNDPNLPSYVQVAAGVGGRTWALKTALEIIADLRTGFVALRTNSKDRIDPKKTPITIAIATNCVDYLTVTTEFGWSVLDWLKTNYPMARVESAPQLNSASGGFNVFYMYAETIQNSGTDGGNVFAQIVPSKFQLVGVSQGAKAYVEDYSNATAGVLLKRPFAVVRYYNI